MDWKENLDSWKSRRRKMSEEVFRRQEEIRRMEQEEQWKLPTDKKTKTFSEMVESRAHRGRALSLCLLSDPLETQGWEEESKNDSSHPFSEGSEENSTANSEDEGKILWSDCTNGNGIQQVRSGCRNKAVEAVYADSGLESITSSHRAAGDTPDSCSDFSQDSGSSIGCDSPRASGLLLSNLNLLEDYNTKEKLKGDLRDSFHDAKNPDSDSLDDLDVLTNSAFCDMPNEAQMSHNGSGHSVESENEVFVDDFEELHAESKIFLPGNLKNKETALNANSERAVAKVESIEICNGTTNGETCPRQEEEKEEEDLNVVFRSQPPEKNPSDPRCDARVLARSSRPTIADALPDVDKVAEEMERLILQQLEEEERAKELSMKVSSSSPFGSPEYNLTVPSKQPPTEKPPPPPSAENETQKQPAPLKRVSSTKRLRKEIHKRRSNFLGIENADDSIASGECLLQPPPPLEQILKVEMELERESRRRLDIDLRLQMEEIASSIDAEEGRATPLGPGPFDSVEEGEEDRIQKLREERLNAENERVAQESQKARLREEQQLKEREEYVRKQEVEMTAPALSSDASNLPSNAQPPRASLCSAVESFSGGGDSVSNALSVPEAPASAAGLTAREKPVVPPKPLKKKEAIRKERERLRQEQEALQREREEHRRLLKEQGEGSQKQPTAPSRLAPVIPPYSAQLTNATAASENIVYSSHDPQNTSGTLPTAAPYGNSASQKSSRPVCSPRKSAAKDLQDQQKQPSPKKQLPEQPSPNSKYNKNHWLIQEAEMRRLAECPPQTCLVEDSVCSLNAPVQGRPYRPSRDWPPKKLPPATGSYANTMGKGKRIPPKPPAKPSRLAASLAEKPEQMLSVSGRKRCSHCSEELGRGAAMIIESLQLYYHIHCFVCCVCQAKLGNGSCGTDVRVRNNKLHCHNCYSNDEAGLKFSQV